MATPNDPVPQTESIAEVYATDPNGTNVPSDQKQRWNDFIGRFQSLYGAQPNFVARSPGRVNIIGEHIDYNLYDVLPAALGVDVLIAVKTVSPNGEEASVNLANSNKSKFPARQFSVPKEGDVEIDATSHDWVNYFKAGLRVALKFLRDRAQGGKFVPVSMEALADGNVPPGGGVSSSAAFVCSSALAVVKANGHDITRQELFDIALVSERAVGVYSGGWVSYLFLLNYL